MSNTVNAKIKKLNGKHVYFLCASLQSLGVIIKPCPLHLKQIVVCTLNSSMRQGEISNLKWSQIRNGFIYLTKSKTNEVRQIPVNYDLALMFKQIKAKQNPKDNVIAIDGKPPKVLQLNTNHVFTFEGKAINGVKS